jgi:hypothetical protein
VNEEASGVLRHSSPSITDGDIKTLMFHLYKELDQLDHFNSRLRIQLSQEAEMINARYESIASSLSSPTIAASSRSSIYQHRTSDLYTGGGGGSSSFASSSSTSNIGGSIKSPNLPSSSSMPMATYSAAAGTSASSSMMTSRLNKRVKKRKDEADQSCLSCSATETPEWRKGPTGPRTLCNACGLLFAKQSRKREVDAQARGERPGGSRPLAPEAMSNEEKEQSLIELKIAVNARSNLSPI